MREPAEARALHYPDGHSVYLEEIFIVRFEA